MSPQSIRRMLNASLANITSILTDELVLRFSFNLDGNPTAQKFRILKIGKFQGILGMDWLGQNQAGIYCNQGTVSFVSSQGEKVEIQGISRRNPIWVVKPNKLIKGLKKGLPIYVLKLNKPKPLEERDEPS